ncbi:MAG: (2Fe-2S) ferredoxin domain-containing protein [Elainellaceae cyanobacterium]
MESTPASAPIKRHCILVCQGRTCLRSGAGETITAFREQTALPVTVMEAGCMSLCSVGPNVRVMPDEVSYCRLTADNVHTVVAEHIEGDRPVPALFHPRMHGYAHLAQATQLAQPADPVPPHKPAQHKPAQRSAIEPSLDDQGE